MGYWNITAKDLKFGDEIRIGMYGFWKVGDVDTGGAAGRIAVRVRWIESELDQPWWWEDFAPDESLTVRR